MRGNIFWRYEKDDEPILASDVAHSAKKIHKVYSFVSLNAKKNDPYGNLLVDRNRKGRSGELIPFKRDLSKALFVEDDRVPT